MNSRFAIFISVLMFVAFCFVLFGETLNAPSYDDYIATVSFIKRFYFDSSNTWEKINVLISKHNDHRIVVSRLLASGYYLLFGRLNFTHLIFIQNVLLLGSFAFLVRLMLGVKVPVYAALLICATFFFDLAFYQVSFYYWGGIQYYSVFFFSVLSLYCLNRSVAWNSKSFWAGVVFVILAVFSFGNGFLALFLGGYLLWAKNRYRSLAIWSTLSLALFLLLFMNFEPSTGPQSGPFRIDWMARLFFTFVGSFIYVNPPEQWLRLANIVVCALLGLGITIYWVGLFFTGYARKRPFLYSLLSLPILTALVISYSRFESKAAGGIAPRYMFFSAFIPIVLILILQDKGLLKPRQLKTIVLASLTVWAFSFYFNLLEFQKMNQDIEQRIVQWKSDDSTKLVYYAEVEPNSEIRRWALEHRIISE